MANKRTGRRASKPANGQSGKAASGETVKVTLRLSVETSQRLGVESVMSGEPQSAIAERVLGSYLRRWRLPSTIDPSPATTPDQSESAA